MALVTLPTGLKGSNEVIKAAFALLKCEPLGGVSVSGWSKTSDFLRCEYRYYLKHIRQVRASLVADSSKNQDVGSFAHALLALHYAAMLPAPYDSGDGQLISYPGYRNPCPTPEEFLAALRASGVEIEAFHLAKQLWEGYTDFWGEEGFQPIGVEMSAGDPEQHTSRYDLLALVRDPLGIHDGLWIVEHKTASSKTDVELWKYDGEIMGEMLSWRLSQLSEVFGEPLRGVCINVLWKPPLSRGRAPYSRLWIPVNWDLVDDFAKHRRWRQSEILTCAKLNHWPRRHYGCVARYDKCPFWDHCSSLSDSFLVPIEPGK